MVRQQLQSSLGVFSLVGINTYWANRKPDRTSDRSIFVPSIYLVNPVRSDTLALNNDGFHRDVLSIS